MLDLLLNLDYWLFKQINGTFCCSLFDSFFFWITDLHKILYFKILALPLLFLIFYRFLKKEAFALFFILVLAVSVSDFSGAKVKSIFQRSRPENVSALQVAKRSDAGDFSFYSNHTSNMFTFATYTSHFIPQLKIPLFLLASSVGYSRIYNGVHFPSDVLAGILMGLFWGKLFSKLSDKWRKRKSYQ